MSAPLYPCRQHVTFTDKRYLGSAWSGDFVIIRHRPLGDEAPRYRIKSAGEVYRHVAYEDQLATSFTIFR